jgi:hypothetical protein
MPEAPAAPRRLARWLLALVAPMMLGALAAGLLRIGWALPLLKPSLAAAHGPLFVCGVLGTLIGLERAVALGRRWAFTGPLLTVLGGALLLLGRPPLGAVLITAASAALLTVYGILVARAPARFLITMALGSAAWLGGNILWLAGRPLALVALWWGGFLVLTIVGERLELGRMRQYPPRVLWAFTASAGTLLLGLAVAVAAFDAGTRLAGAGMLLLAVWLLRYDIARRTIRKPGVPRYSAACILSGSAWLAVSGAIGLLAGAQYAGPGYDALLHTLFVGFVFAMIFGHAPIIVPAVAGVPLTLMRSAYLPLAMLHLSLVLRLAGDLAGLGELRRWGGMLNAVTIGVFVLVTLLEIRAGAARRPTPAMQPERAR